MHLEPLVGELIKHDAYFQLSSLVGSIGLVVALIS